MQRDTRKAVHELLKTFAQRSLKNYDIESLKRAYPFHRLFFDELGLIAAKQERSLVTKMGQTLYPGLARLIASEKYADVVLEKVIEGDLNAAMVSKIDEIVRDLRARQRRPNHAQEMAQVLSSASGTAKRHVRVIADVFISDFGGGPFFAELKTPQPNLDICAESKSKILTFKALLREQNPNSDKPKPNRSSANPRESSRIFFSIRANSRRFADEKSLLFVQRFHWIGTKAYLAFYYNPFITRSAYSHSFTKQIMDMETEVLMGEEFWNGIGDTRTFSELLEIIEEVGNEIRKEKDSRRM